MRKSLTIVITLILTLTLIACGGSQEELGATETEEIIETETEAEENIEPEEDYIGGTLMMATTTSTADTGILGMLVEEFYADTRISLEYTSVGTGEALAIGRNGDVDIVFVHARASEELFVEGGYGVERVPVMFNDFVVIGPDNIVELSDDVEQLFSVIHLLEMPFVSRGDDSGTHQMELAIWERIGIDPSTNPNYMDAGQGMGATIMMADEMNAFTLADRGTWLRQSRTADIEISLIIIGKGDPALFNQYGIIAVNPEVHPEVNIEAANAFIDWIISDRVQGLIAEFGAADFGEPLFVPNAGTDN